MFTLFAVFLAISVTTGTVEIGSFTWTLSWKWSILGGSIGSARQQIGTEVILYEQPPTPIRVPPGPHPVLWTMLWFTNRFGVSSLHLSGIEQDMGPCQRQSILSTVVSTRWPNSSGLRTRERTRGQTGGQAPVCVRGDTGTLITLNPSLAFYPHTINNPKPQ